MKLRATGISAIRVAGRLLCAGAIFEAREQDAARLLEAGYAVPAEAIEEPTQPPVVKQKRRGRPKG